MQQVHGNSFVQRFSAHQLSVQRDDQTDLEKRLRATDEIKPDPNDAYLKPPLNWDQLAVPAAPPENPQPELKIKRIYPGPPPIGFEKFTTANFADTRNMLIPPDIQSKRMDGYRDMDAAATTLESSWKSAAPLISAYNTASSEIKDGGALGPSPAGENWMPVQGASSYDQLAGGQVLGTHTKMDDLFKGQGGTSLSGVDPNAGAQLTPDKRAAVSKAMEASRAKDLDVKTAVDKLNSHIKNVMPSAGLGIKAAILAIEITEANENKDEKKEAKEKLEIEKKEAAEKVETAVKILKAVPEAAEGGAGTVELVGILANQIIGGIYEEKIKAASQAVRDADFRVRGLVKEANLVGLERAKLDFKTAQDQVELLKRDIQKALADRKDAYHAAAVAAGKAAGGGEGGERIQAALEAIPRVQTVVGRVDAVQSKTILPAYTAASGITFRVASERAPEYFDTATFILFLSQLKAYKAQFDGLHNEWQGRLDSLTKLASSFNVPGT
jgi:hypothetical protein